MAALIFAHGGGARFPGGLFPPVDLPSFAETVAISCVGGGLGLVSRIPAARSSGPWRWAPCSMCWA